MLFAKEKGWETEKSQVAAALHTAVKELLAKEGSAYSVNDDFEFEPIDVLIVKAAKAMQSSGAVKKEAKENFRQIVLTYETSILETPTKDNTTQSKDQSAPNDRKKASILDRYRAGLSYLDECGVFDEAKLREFNRITGNRFSDANIADYLNGAKDMIGGMEDVKQILRSSMVEGISVFEEVERNGIDLSKYDV